MDILTLLMTCSMFYNNSITNAMIAKGSAGNPLLVTTYLSDGGMLHRSDFKTPAEAASYAQAQIEQGNQVDVGIMQLPIFWLDKLNNRVTLEQLFRPCKNMVVATDIMNHALAHCAALPDPSHRTACMLAVYKTGAAEANTAYSQQIIRYAQQHKVKDNPLTQPLAEQIEQTQTKPIVLPEPHFGAPQKPIVATTRADEDNGTELD